MKVGVVRNPKSGRGAGGRGWPSVLETLRERVDRLLVEDTTAPGSARHQAASLAERGCEIVVAAGGDGTVTDVAQGLLGTDSALGVLPMGTGNDFARTIGIGLSLDRALAAITQGNRQRIDVARWQQGEQQGHFINVAGCGFDAAVAERVNRGFRRLRGRAAYLAAILATLRTYRATRLSLLVDGEAMEKRGMLCAIANAKSYGGGLLVAPTAELQDGLLDLVIVGDLGRFEFLRNFPRVLKGTHLDHPKVLHRRFETLEIESDPASPFLVDGELLPPGRVRVEVVPAALDVMMPRV